MTYSPRFFFFKLAQRRAGRHGDARNVVRYLKLADRFGWYNYFAKNP